MRVLQVTSQSASLFVTATLKQLWPLDDFYYYARSEQLMPTFEGLLRISSMKNIYLMYHAYIFRLYVNLN